MQFHLVARAEVKLYEETPREIKEEIWRKNSESLSKEDFLRSNR